MARAALALVCRRARLQGEHGAAPRSLLRGALYYREETRAPGAARLVSGALRLGDSLVPALRTGHHAALQCWEYRLPDSLQPARRVRRRNPAQRADQAADFCRGRAPRAASRQFALGVAA